MEKDEIRRWAKELLEVHNDHYEFSDVYEADGLEDATQEELEAIYAEMYAARIDISWED